MTRTVTQEISRGNASIDLGKSLHQRMLKIWQDTEVHIFLDNSTSNDKDKRFNSSIRISHIFLTDKSIAIRNNNFFIVPKLCKILFISIESRQQQITFLYPLKSQQGTTRKM